MTELPGRTAAEVWVLVVDDDEDDAQIVRELLAGADRTRFTTKWACDSQQALAVLGSETFDVLLLDVRLGPDSGLELLQQLRASGLAVPIVMMTSTTDPLLDDLAMAAGATDYLVKGRFDAVLLERTIRYALSNHRQREQLAAVVRRQNEILGMAAHDLRNPLGIVQGYAAFLRDRLEQIPIVEQRNLIDRMGASVRFMVMLIDDLLDLSSIESGVISLALEQVDLRELVEHVAELDRVLARPKEIEIVVEASDRPLHARLDRRRFQQVLQNLVGNGVKFSHPGGEVRISLSEADGAIRITVRDRGIGIGPEFLGQIFAPFARERGAGTQGERSTGLGLAIVRRIIDAHGGRIWVESEVGVGTAFHIEVPSANDVEARPA